MILREEGKESPGGSRTRFFKASCIFFLVIFGREFLGVFLAGTRTRASETLGGATTTNEYRLLFRFGIAVLLDFASLSADVLPKLSRRVMPVLSVDDGLVVHRRPGKRAGEDIGRSDYVVGRIMKQRVR